ncbi:uncharacterized protein PAN0_002d1163 [Moesziomyces antarcticus]|uniref:Uncharacterized protein n=1 Tax=Pseudozyma antarctica TaxID=84753 RepID=A0A5C3FJD0_PSEA2|nr:uncharacterized protein PAN0_002d1163 [Moesziomyces antarcticus]GAK62961.1 hypothetical protein PAN0_002d1163 [Moesziomyces antarcticus]SPO43559.1 uncharacterized protein PSANT_01244 [Moesziomyces antarcticus]
MAARALLRSASVALLIRSKPKTLHVVFLDQHLSESAGWARQAGLCSAAPGHAAIDRLASDVGGSGLGASVQRRWASVEARVESQRVTGSFHLSRNLHEPGSALRQESAPVLASSKSLKPSDPRKDANPSRISDQEQGLTKQWSILRRPPGKGRDSSPKFQERADAGGHSARSVLKSRDPPQDGQRRESKSGSAKKAGTSSDVRIQIPGPRGKRARGSDGIFLA